MRHAFERAHKTQFPSQKFNTKQLHQPLHSDPIKTTMKQDANNDNVVAEAIMSLKAHIHPPVPNPAPLGLIGFGLTTCLLQLKHTRIAGDEPDEMNGVDTVVMGFAMFFGGLLQIIAGISEIRRNNVFGYTAFCLYGGFWMSMATIEIVSLLATGGPPLFNAKAAQAMLMMVSIFTFMLWILTFKLNKTLCSLFGLLGITCFLLSFGVQYESVDIVGGYFGIMTSVNAFWLAFAELVNDVIGEGKEVIPLGHWNLNDTGVGGAHAPGRIQAGSPSAIAVRPNDQRVKVEKVSRTPMLESLEEDISDVGDDMGV